MKIKDFILNFILILFIIVFSSFLIVNTEEANHSSNANNVINEVNRIYSYKCDNVELINSKGQSYIGQGLSELNILIEDRIVKASFIQMSSQEKIYFCKNNMVSKKIDTMYVVSGDKIRLLAYKGLID